MKKRLKLSIASLIVALLFSACSSPSDPDAIKNAGLEDYPMMMIKGEKAQSGKPLVLEFWASWCGPCRAQVPHLNSLYSQLKDSNIQFVALTDEPLAFTREFVSTQNMQYPIATDPDRDYLRLAGINFIPQAIILDENARIVWQGHTGKLDMNVILKALEKSH